MLLLLPLSVSAATLTPAGCLGNSGGAGPGLVRVGDPRVESGVAVDADGLWLSGGDRLNHLGFSGHLLASYPLEPAGALLTARTLAVAPDRLACLGRVKQQNFVFVLATPPGAAVPLLGAALRPLGAALRPLGAALPKRLHDWYPEVLCPQLVDGQWLLLSEARDQPPTLAVTRVDPVTGARTPAFELPGKAPSGLAWDPQRRVLYLGGQLGDGWAITALTVDGRPAPGEWPVPTTKTPAIPTSFVGRVSLAGGALWDSAHYGFLARLGLDARVDPGRVVEWHHELKFVTQVVDVPGGGEPAVQSLLLATNGPDSVYWANWDTRERELRLVRRFGCLPTITSLGLGDDGDVTVGTFRGQLWWRFDDDADTPPRKVDLHIATTPVWFRDDRMLALGALYRLDSPQNTRLWPLVFARRRGDRNEARRYDAAPPAKRLTGLTVQAQPGRGDATLWTTDPDARQLLSARVALGTLEIDPRSWRTVPLTGLTPTAPTDVVALPDGRLLLADGPRLYLVDRAGVASLWLEDGFGPRVRCDSDGVSVLVSDTERHRVVWYDLATRARLAQCGTTDQRGEDAAHLDQPAQVAVRGARAVVADTGNQRVLRLRLER